MAAIPPPIFALTSAQTYNKIIDYTFAKGKKL